jgi:hypothetical protein
MPDANPISGPYNVPAYNYTSADAPNTAAEYSRTVRVTATLNNPLTLTGSFANNAGFLVMNTGSIVISSSNGVGYVAMDFHEPGQNHTIFPIALSYVSASAAGDITILYYQ